MKPQHPLASEPDVPIRGALHCMSDGSLVGGDDDLARMLGYESWDELSKRAANLRDLLADPLDRQQLSEGVHRVLAGDETRWVRKNGTSAWFLSAVKLLEWSATGEDLLEVSVEDVTERQNMEDQLRQGQKMELLGQLTGGVIHDFNNILATILTHSELLEQGVAEGRTEEALADIDQLRRAAERGSSMIRHLLVFSRPEDLERHPIALNDVVRDTVRLLRRLLPQTIEIELREDDELHAVADPGAMEQIIMNLATNARDAMPRGGRLTIELRRTTLDRRHLNQHGWGQPGEYVSIIVTDTGTGMAPEVMARVFEPFFTTKERGRGTGLGLPMVYGLMKQHRGFVEITPAEGGGTQVCLYLRPAPERPADTPSAMAGSDAEPFTARAPSPRVAGDTAAPTSESLQILLVEDDEALRAVMARSLRRAGHDVLTASDGHQALDLLDAGERPALIIADVIMPGMGGVELQKILSSSGTAPPILLTSGLDASRAFQGGPLPEGVPFLQKPWTIDELLARVESTLEGA
ncbi:MAG: response regulator [Gemmatimonadales bacterium]|nr:MAG: response regulator [Gemmatimonadales bacterium]